MKFRALRSAAAILTGALLVAGAFPLGACDPGCHHDEGTASGESVQCPLHAHHQRQTPKRSAHNLAARACHCRAALPYTRTEARSIEHEQSLLYYNDCPPGPSAVLPDRVPLRIVIQDLPPPLRLFLRNSALLC